jgi:hypothetical protein
VCAVLIVCDEWRATLPPYVSVCSNWHQFCRSTYLLSASELETAPTIIGTGNLEFVKANPKLRLQNGTGSDFFFGLKCGENLHLVNLNFRKIIHYLYGILAGTTKNEPKMRENLKPRNLTPGFYYTAPPAWALYHTLFSFIFSW